MVRWFPGIRGLREAPPDHRVASGSLREVRSAGLPASRECLARPCASFCSPDALLRNHMVHTTGLRPVSQERGLPGREGLKVGPV